MNKKRDAPKRLKSPKVRSDWSRSDRHLWQNQKLTQEGHIAILKAPQHAKPPSEFQIEKSESLNSGIT